MVSSIRFVANSLATTDRSSWITTSSFKRLASASAASIAIFISKNFSGVKLSFGVHFDVEEFRPYSQSVKVRLLNGAFFIITLKFGQGVMKLLAQVEVAHMEKLLEVSLPASPVSLLNFSTSSLMNF